MSYEPYILGFFVGVLSSISGAYLLFQTKAECHQCNSYLLEKLNERTKEMETIRKCIDQFKAELREHMVRQEKLLMSIIVAMPIQESAKHELINANK